MKTASLLLLAAALLLGSIGCAHRRGAVNGTCAQAPETCAPCAPGCAPGGQAADPAVNGAVAYPYYTLHGPRDFLARNPRSIGP